jgi:O-Antigen ligase
LGLTGAIFLLVFAAGCVLALTRHPVYGAIAYVSVYFFNPTSHWWGQGALAGVRWALLSAAVTLIALVLRRPPTGVRGNGSILRHGATWLLLLFVAWLGVQFLWALDWPSQLDLFTYYVKFLLGLLLIYKVVDSERHLRLILWAYVCGCFYFGVIAFTSYTGGRFEGFGGAVGEANEAALTLVVGIFFASSLLLEGTLLQRGAVLCMIPFILNALVTTISRSGFLALLAGGIVYNLFPPARLRTTVRALSVLAAVLFLMVTGPGYWTRIHSIEYRGADIAGTDTGGGRLELISAQWRMFTAHPFGCGAMCTAVLSPNYLSDRFLATTTTGVRERASHNTLMSMLVEHGIPGVVFYLGTVLWLVRGLRRLAGALRNRPGGTSATVLPAIAASVAAICVADQFVSYVKFEVRIWIIALVMVLLDLATQPAAQPSPAARAVPAPAGAPPGRYRGSPAA